MATKIKQKRTYAAPRSAYLANISVPDETPTRANINSINQAYSNARQQVNNVMTQYELDKGKALLQDSINRNIANEKILSIGAGQRPIDTQRLNNLIFNRTEYKAGGSVGRKRYAVGGSLSNRINRRNYWFDENDGIVEYDSSAPEPTPDTTEEEPVVQQRTAPRRTQPTTTITQNKPANKGIVTIGTKSFNSAFRQARIAGLDKFRWNGKVYGTKLANEVGKTTKEKARNAVKPVSQKPRNNSTNNTTTRSSNRLNNSNDAVRASYSRTNGRITGQLPNVTVTASGKNQPKNKPVMSWRDYVDAAKKDPSIKNTSGYKNARKQEFERMRTRAAGPGTQRWANNKRPGQGNNVQTYTKYRRNNPYIVSRGNGLRSVGNSW